MREQLRLGRGGFDHCAARSEIAAQYGETAARDQRLLAREDDVAVEHFRAGDILAQRLPVDRACVEREQIADVLEQGAQTAGVIKILHQKLTCGTYVG